jgi:hypothetical protein
VSLFVYKWVRQHPRRFLVRPGHERPAFERVVDDESTFLVVERIRAAGEEAATGARRGGRR